MSHRLLFFRKNVDRSRALGRTATATAGVTPLANRNYACRAGGDRQPAAKEEQ